MIACSQIIESRTMQVSQRAVVFDTETTGLDPQSGDRVVEIACVELYRDLPTGASFHTLVDPERDIPEEATKVHGLTRADLMGKPRFAEVADALLAFLGDSPLIAHNAAFDFGFLNAEFARLDRPALDPGRMIDTFAMAKSRFPGLPNSLDALCRRFGIDLSERTKHNALLDCRLLSDVYVELTGGRQPTLLPEMADVAVPAFVYDRVGPRSPVLIEVSPEALARHVAFLARIPSALWLS